jgi:anti-sigma B factor antagonist
VNLNTQVRRENGFAIVELKGEVNVFTSPQLREKLVKLLGSGRRDLVVDLDGLEFCDSNGLDVLIDAVRRINDLGGSLGIVCSRENIMKLLRSTGLTKVLAVYPSVKAATAEMTSPETSREPSHR